MARSRTCPHCWRTHDRGTPCQVVPLTQSVKKGLEQRAADAAEDEAIRSYLQMASGDNAA